METTEKIAEAYVRHIKKWATIPNVGCDGRHEIDLIAVNPVNMERYHIESGISVSYAYSKLTDKPFSRSDLKKRTKTARQRRTIGYFVEQKFQHPDVMKTLRAYGFKKGGYKKIIVSWNWTPGAERAARRRRIDLWKFGDIVTEIVEAIGHTREYFADDTMRTLHLFAKANQRKRSGRQSSL